MAKNVPIDITVDPKFIDDAKKHSEDMKKLIESSGDFENDFNGAFDSLVEKLKKHHKP